MELSKIKASGKKSSAGQNSLGQTLKIFLFYFFKIYKHKKWHCAIMILEVNFVQI